jgi:2-hydroxychromene-2-carboxylate isomerase
MAVFFYALAEKRERDFLINAGEAVWARGINLATDKGMRKVTGRTGLFWPDVLEAMQDDSWRQEVERNRASMEESGSWGVPTLRMADFVVWGQDRDWLLVRHIEDLCDTGEGILI